MFKEKESGYYFTKTGRGENIYLTFLALIQTNQPKQCTQKKNSQFASFFSEIFTIFLPSCLAVSFSNLYHPSAQRGCSFPRVNWKSNSDTFYLLMSIILDQDFEYLNCVSSTKSYTELSELLAWNPLFLKYCITKTCRSKADYT